jgi:hypothetical protein
MWKENLYLNSLAFNVYCKEFKYFHAEDNGRDSLLLLLRNNKI